MSAAVEDRRQNAYLTAVTLSQAELDETFLGGENQIEVVATITKTIGVTTYTLNVADRPKYVGDTFYEGRAQFPVVTRTVGELQSPSIQYSDMEIILNNVDGFYNQYLESGASYISLIGARVVVQIGIRDLAGSLKTIFDGLVPNEGGFVVERQTIRIIARDKADSLNKIAQLPYINTTDFPSAPVDSQGKVIPFALGDWEAGYNFKAMATQVNVADATLPTPFTADVWADAPLNFYGGLIGYNVGGGFFVFSIGTYTPDNISKCHIKRGNDLIETNFVAAPSNTAGYWSVQVTSLIKADGSGNFAYVYQSGDVAAIKVKIPYAIGKYSNPIELAREVLYTLGGKNSGDLDAASWAALIAKSTPAQSDMTHILARLWVGKDSETIMSVARGLLEQVRVELYLDSAGLLHVASLHPEDFPAPASCARIEQAEINEESLTETADERTFFNNAAVNYAFTPLTGKTELQTGRKKNQNSIDKMGKQVLKDIDCPALYVSTDAVNQQIEFLRFFSTGFSYLGVEVAWVHLLRDLHQVMSFNYQIGSINFSAAPMMIRDFGVNPQTGSVILKLLSLANFAYAAYSPANAARFLSSDAQSIVDA